MTTKNSKGNTTTTKLPTAPEGMIDFQSDSFASVSGFWNLPKDGDDSAMIGEVIHGVLLSEVRTRAGKPLDNPFFVVELLKPHDRITVKENGEDEDKSVEAGTRVGFSSTWKALSGLQRKVGHEVWICYQGRAKLPNGRVAKQFTVKTSGKPVREVEQVAEHVMAQGDDDLPEQLRG